MKALSRIALVLLTVTVVGVGLLSQRMAASWAAPSQQSDLPALAVLTPENSTAMVEALRLDAKGVTDAHFFPNGKTMALAMPEGVVLYDVATWTPQRTLVTGASRRIALSADGEMVATMAGNEAQLWRVSDGVLLQTLSGHSNTIEDLAFSPASSPENILATASLDRTVRLWRSGDGQLHRQLNHLGHVYSVAFRFDNLVLASGSDAGTTLWDPDRGGRLRIADVSFDIVNQLSFSPDGLTLALAMNAGIVKVRNSTNYGTVHETPRNQATTTVAFAPNGRLMAYGNSDERIYVGGSGGNAPYVTLSGHQGAINSLTFSPDGRLLVSTGADGTLRVWGSVDQSPPTATSAATATPRPTLSPTVAPTVAATATPVTRVTVVVRAPTSPLPTPIATPIATPDATPTNNAPLPPASSVAGLPRSGQGDPAQNDAGPALPVVFIEPQETALTPTDWQRVTHISGPGANVTLCQDDLLWLSSNQQVWSFDGQSWQQELADQAATVACDPDGVPYALVTSPSAEAGRIVATLYRHQEGTWKEVGISSFPAGVGQIWFDWAVDRDGSLWTPIMLDAGTEAAGTANADTETGVINGVVHYDQGVWDLYVGEDETRLDDPNSLPGSLVKGMTIHKLIPAAFGGPESLAADAWSAPLAFYPDLDILKDGSIWLKRPGQWPIFFDGERWQLGVDADLPAQLLATFSSDGTEGTNSETSSSLQEALIAQVTSVTVGVLNAQDVTQDEPQEASWIAVGGGVLHKQDGQWTLYVPYDYPDTLIPLAEGADGSVWFWDGLGIMRFDGVGWQSFTGNEEFTFLFNPMNSWPAATLDATVGPDGALWMGGLRLLPDGTPISLPVAGETGG